MTILQKKFKLKKRQINYLDQVEEEPH